MIRGGDQMNKFSFDVVQLWYNDIYHPYTLTPTRKDSKKVFAIKINGEYFLLGEENDGIHICDADE